MATDQAAAAPEAKEKKGRTKGDCLYYRVKCRDNGVGMPHEKVGGRWKEDGERWTGNGEWCRVKRRNKGKGGR